MRNSRRSALRPASFESSSRLPPRPSLPPPRSPDRTPGPSTRPSGSGCPAGRATRAASASPDPGPGQEPYAPDRVEPGSVEAIASSRRSPASAICGGLSARFGHGAFAVRVLAASSAPPASYRTRPRSTATSASSPRPPARPVETIGKRRRAASSSSPRSPTRTACATWTGSRPPPPPSPTRARPRPSRRGPHRLGPADLLFQRRLHSTELGSPEMVMELAYRLAVSDQPMIQRIRRELIISSTPSPSRRPRQAGRLVLPVHEGPDRFRRPAPESPPTGASTSSTTTTATRTRRPCSCPRPSAGCSSTTIRRSSTTFTSPSRCSRPGTARPVQHQPRPILLNECSPCRSPRSAR